MTDLIERLETATEGSRGLDKQVYESVLGRQLSDIYDCFLGRMVEEVPHYTTSLDAVLTLAGENWLSVLLNALARAAGFFIEFRDKNGHIRKKIVLWCCVAVLKGSVRP